MKKLFLSLPIVIVAGLILSGCDKEQDDGEVISKRFVHKYGYAVSKSEWDSNNYPGQTISTLRNGVTVTSTYENGLLHGPTTHTHPHSQTVQYFYLYDFGDLKKEVVYDALGMPIWEKAKLSPHRYTVTMWYGDGTPMCTEDYANDELLDAKYFTLNNELESNVERGNGLKTRRDRNGVLLSKNSIEAGYLVKQEAFYPNGNLEEVALYKMNQRNGERRVYTEGGDPLAVEEWVNNQIHGKATYFVTGKKQAEVYFIRGAKHGIETQYIDGQTVEKEILWNNNERHGPTKFYVGDQLVKTEWYYSGNEVNKRRYDELIAMENMALQAAEEFNESAPR